MAPTEQALAEKPSSVKLYYFDIPARAEVLRLSLALSGIDFENVLVDERMFKQLKKEHRLPCNQVPVLEVDGKILSQSYAILRYIGRLGGLYPEDPWQAAKVDEVLNWVDDTVDRLIPSLHDNLDPAKKLEMREELAKKTFPQWLGYFANYLESTGNTYAASTELTIADVNAFLWLDWLTCGLLDGIPTNILDNFPTIKAYHQKLKEHPGVKAYYATHRYYYVTDRPDPVPKFWIPQQQEVAE